MRYSFGISDHGKSMGRRECELPDDGAARAEALRFAADILGDPAFADWDGRDLSVEVSGAEGAVRFAVHILSVARNQPLRGEDEQHHSGEGHPS